MTIKQPNCWRGLFAFHYIKYLLKNINFESFEFSIYYTDLIFDLITYYEFNIQLFFEYLIINR